MSSAADKANEDLAAVLETAHDAYVSIDEAGAVIGWNAAAERMFGWSKHEAMGRPLRDIVIPERYRARHDAGLRRFLDTGEGPLLNTTVEISACRRGGEEFPVELAISSLRHGGKWRFNAFIRDTSERERANALQRRLATIVEHSADAIVSRTRDGIITSWNPAAAELFGWSADEMIGGTIERIVPDSRAGEADRLVERTLGGDPVRDFETQRLCRDGRVVDVSITISPLTDEEGSISELSMIMRDVSARAETLRATEAANAALARTNELKEQFIAVASHELRTPLTSIAGFTTTLLAHWPRLQDEKRLQFLQIVDEQTQRLHRLTDDVLLLSRVGAAPPPGERRAFDVARLARQALDEMQLADEVDVTAHGSTVAEGFPDDVHRILLNYVTNAKSYGAPPITVDVFEDEGVVVRVCDAGRGVDPAFAPHLFESFSRSEESQDGQGAGLGLAIVQALADRVGGHAWHEPNRPSGACFCLRLPAAGLHEA
jgi:PAS domain S-box-containing protein